MRLDFAESADINEDETKRPNAGLRVTAGPAFVLVSVSGGGGI